jgi:type IV secretion system protein VirB4
MIGRGGLARQVAAGRDVPAAARIPYRAHLDPHVVVLADGTYLQAFRLAGRAFDTTDDASLNAWHERLNLLWRNVASPSVALWTHVARREAELPVEACGSGFADGLAAAYERQLAARALWLNELYLSVLWRPATPPARVFAWALRQTPSSDPDSVRAALDACAKLRQTVAAALDPYEPEPLGARTIAGVARSSLLEFLAELVDGERRVVRLPRAPLNEVLATARLSFGAELVEVRGATHRRYGAMLGIKEYPTPTLPGLFNALLSAPFPFVLTQSFTCLAKGTAQGLMQRQAARLRNAGDFAVSQVEALSEALDQLTSNAFVMGEHHLSLQVLSPPVPDRAPAEPALAALDEHLALARTWLADAGLTVAREDLGLEAAFWAQLPGAFVWRPRKAVITSRNFAAMAPFHGHPTGRPDGHHWGPAVACLTTRARSPYWFALHASDPREPQGGRRDLGHTLICGPTGSGKTVLIGFLVAMLGRQGVTQVLFDKDQGLSILVRALGGQYLPLAVGAPTGCNPLQLAPTPANVEFLKAWLRLLVRPPGQGDVGSAREAADLEQALGATLALPVEARRLSRLVEFLDPTDPEGVYARLSPWCTARGGDLAWAFDAGDDAIVPLLGAHALVGFDVTQFLDHPRVSTPLTLYLLHVVRQLLDGRRLVCWIDEFWRLLGDPAFERFANDGPKTWRKLNGVICFATQSPSDVLSSPISRTLIEQTATKIFLPNAEAGPDYVDGFGLSEREYLTIRETLDPAAREFLVRQAAQSVVCALDLGGLGTELAVISGRARTVALADRLIAEAGSEPADWLSLFDAHVAAGGALD